MTLPVHACSPMITLNRIGLRLSYAGRYWYLVGYSVSYFYECAIPVQIFTGCYGLYFYSFAIKMTSWSLTLSKAFVRSTKHILAILLYSMASSVIQRILNMASVVDLFCLYLCYSSLIPLDSTLFAMIYLRSLAVELRVRVWFCSIFTSCVS